MAQCSPLLGALRAQALLQRPTAAHAELPGALMQRCRLAHHDHAFVVLGQRLHSTDEDEEALHQWTIVGRAACDRNWSLGRVG